MNKRFSRIVRAAVRVVPTVLLAAAAVLFFLYALGY